MKTLRPPQRHALYAAAIAGAVLFPLAGGNDAAIDAVTNAFTYAVLALGLNIVVGYTGLLDLGYAAFFAIGAYAYGVLDSFQLMPHWSAAYAPLAALHLVQRVASDDGTGDLVRFIPGFWLMLPLAGLLSAACGAAFGAPTLRLRGDYLAIVTLGFGEIVPIVARNWGSVTNGAQGLNGIAAPHLFGFRFGIAAWPYYYVALALLLLLMRGSSNLRRSRFGRAMVAIREDEIAAACMGIDTTRIKLLAFALGAFCAGVGGVSFVAKLHTATPEMFGFPVSVMILSMAVLGGLGSVPGVVLGAGLLSLTQSSLLPALATAVQHLGAALNLPWLRDQQPAGAGELLFGLLLVLTMLFRRQGLVPESPAAGLPPETSTPPAVPAQPAAPPPPATPALRVTAATIRFGGLLALNALDLTVPAGAVVAVIGPNGSGKSTLFNAISGLVKLNAGAIDLFGQNLAGLRPDQVLRAGAARTFQNLRLFPELSVLENVLAAHHPAAGGPGLASALIGAQAARAAEQASAAAARAALARVAPHLLPRAHEKAAALAYADRRRVEIARALAASPRLLLLDEPAAGMNPSESLALADLIQGLAATGVTILLIEHKLDIVARVAHHVVVLDHGEKLAEGSADSVRRDPRVREAYLGRTAQAAEAGLADAT